MSTKAFIPAVPPKSSLYVPNGNLLRTGSIVSLSGPSVGPPIKQENAKSYEEWSRYFGKIDGRFSLYFYNDSLTDVTLVVDGKKIRGHKIILSSCSWEFYVIFNLLKLDKKEVPIQGTTFEVFLSFLEYCYTGWTLLKEDTTWEILRLAYRFNVKPLILVCESHLAKRLTANTCISFYTKGEFLSDTSLLRQKITETMAEDCHALFYHKQFNNLPLKVVRQIVASGLKCDEMVIFEALIKWAKFNCVKIGYPCIPKNYRRVLEDVFFKIRFPAIPAHLFFEILAEYPGILTEKEISNIAKISRGHIKVPTSTTSSTNNQVKSQENGNGAENRATTPQNGVTNDTEGPQKKAENAQRPENSKLRVHTYQQLPEKIFCHAFKSSVIFKCDTPRFLIGFGFYAITADQPKVVSCILHHVNSHPTIQVNCDVDAEKHKVWKTSVDFFYHENHFAQKMQINPNQWYSLFTTFEDKIHVPQTPPLKPYDEEHKMHFRKLIPNVIPYLVFERNVQ
ncbi:BTB/POZ domain-containing protein 6-like [Lutzomyia longipalpis]|uniref:BTB/POZ domain-containing protein 6-like n=1 Tax=Lutzomyia longipalpis TaxID=7200 RepID=UPI002483359F|nr:BTB/POZ domain-containing protein 6-like [Lutzomyia longipalpis]